MLKLTRMKTLVIIPAYNEALNIVKTIQDFESNAPKNVDYIIINDCSKDNTLEVLKENSFYYINGIENLGLFGALQTGFLYAQNKGYDIAIQFDGDGQHNAKYIKDLIKVIEEGYDIAIGSRFVTEKKPFTLRMLGSNLISFLIKLTTGKRIKDPTSGFRAYSLKHIDDFTLDINNPPEPDTLVYMLKKGRKIKEVQVTMNEREFGESYLNPINSAKYMLRMTMSILFIQPIRRRK